MTPTKTEDGAGRHVKALGHLGTALAAFNALKAFATREEVAKGMDLMRSTNPELVNWVGTICTPFSVVGEAEKIAREAHFYQTAKYYPFGPYIHHVERVAKAVTGDDNKAVAWLHDVLEDNAQWSRAKLADAGIPNRIIVSVNLLTRWDGDEPYIAYVQRIVDSKDLAALTVKLADIIDHLSHGTCPPHLMPKYRVAYFTITGQRWPS